MHLPSYLRLDLKPNKQEPDPNENRTSSKQHHTTIRPCTLPVKIAVIVAKDTSCARSASEHTKTHDCEAVADACAELRFVFCQGDEEDGWQGDEDTGPEAEEQSLDDDAAEVVHCDVAEEEDAAYEGTCE